jgi:hypothetical protein
MAGVRSFEPGSVTRGAATKGVNLGFALVFDEIPAPGSSLYRGFKSMISCVCRTPSPTPQIQLGFDFDRISLGFFGWGRKFPAQVHYLTREGDDSDWAAPGARVGGGGGNWAGVGFAREKREKIVGQPRIWPDKIRKIRNSLFPNLFINFKQI